MIPIVILAGGKAQRLGGGDKPLRMLAGKPLLAHVLAKVIEPGVPAAINANGDPKRFAAFGLPVIPDHHTNHPGPLAGIAAGLAWAQRIGAEAALFLSGDCPFLPEDLVERLTDARSAANTVPVCAESLGRFHPVIGIWPIASRMAVEEALSAGDHRVGHLTERLGAKRVAWSALPQDPFFNVNTPEDLVYAGHWLALADKAETLDLLGLKCPLPVLHTRKALARMEAGAVLHVLCSDPLCGLDIPNLLRETGDTGLASTQDKSLSRFLIRKAAR